MGETLSRTEDLAGCQDPFVGRRGRGVVLLIKHADSQAFLWRVCFCRFNKPLRWFFVSGTFWGKLMCNIHPRTGRLGQGCTHSSHCSPGRPGPSVLHSSYCSTLLLFPSLSLTSSISKWFPFTPTLDPGTTRGLGVAMLPPLEDPPGTL